MSFICLKCSNCCKNLNKSDIYINLHSGNGVCMYLENNLCSIYENRPILCKVEESYFFFQETLTKEEYFKLNYKGCYKLNL